MAYPVTRPLSRLLKGRLYSTQVARKTDAALAVETPRFVRLDEFNLVSLKSSSPLSRAVFVVRAGSRYEDETNLGITHTLRHALRSSSEELSAFMNFKHIESAGGIFCALTTRDNAYVSIAGTRDQMPKLTKAAVACLTRSQFKDGEWKRSGAYTSEVAFDRASMMDDPCVVLSETLHSVAYRGGLQNSLYCPEPFIGKHTAEQAMNFFNTYYTPGRMSVVTSGIDEDDMAYQMLLPVAQPRDAPALTGSTLKPQPGKSIYVGGDVRITKPGLNLSYVAIASEGPGLSSPEGLSAAVLQHVLGAGPRVKYGKPDFGKLGKAVGQATDSQFNIQGLNANYTDSGLLGFTVAAEPKDIDKILRTAVQTFRSVAENGVTDEELVRGKASLKAAIAMQMESEEAVLTNIAEQAIGSDDVISLKETLSMVDSVTAAGIQKVAKKAVSGKLSMVCVGQTANVPYADSLLK